MDLSNILFVYQAHPHDSGAVHYTVVAKFLQVPGHFAVLEDHTPDAHFGALEKASPEGIESFLNRLRHSMYFRVVSASDLAAGLEPDLLPTTSPPPGHAPESRFDYFRIGMPQPQLLEFYEGAGHLDGHPLTQDELALIHSNVTNGLASLSYHRDEQLPVPEDTAEVKKSGEGGTPSPEGVELVDGGEDLSKIEPQLEQALAGLRTAVAAGHVHPDVLKTLTGHVFKDQLIPTMGNRKAYEDFQSRPRPGVRVHLDLNDFGGINKVHGFETGNHAIVQAGNAIRGAMDEAVGKKNGKLFRVGGDEFVAHVPSHEHAASFLRNLRSKMDAIPPIGGTHRISTSAGIGNDTESAEKALIQAKTAKKAMNYPAGQAQTHVASLVPGHEGAVPLSPSMPPKVP